MDNIIKFLKETSEKSYALIKDLKKEISFKGEKDFLTNCDLEVEKFFIDEIKKNFKDASIISEEFNSKAEKTKEYFVIDPIDGTANFSTNSVAWGIQSAYLVDGECMACCIYMPDLNRMYTAQKGKGAFMNGEKITVTVPKEKSHSIVSIGDHVLSKPEKIIELQKEVARVRLFGAACYEFTEIARGSTNAHIGFSNHPWDLEPGMLLCREAGGKIYETEKMHIVASDDKTLNVLKKIFE